MGYTLPKQLDVDSLYQPGDYWQKISLRMSGSPSNCSAIGLHIVLVQHSLSPWMMGRNIVSYISTKPLDQGQVFEWTDSFVFDKRYLFLSTTTLIERSCGVLIQIDPYVKPHSGLPPSFHIADKETVDVSDLQTAKLTVLIMGRFHKTWDDAQALCKSVGGHLPSMTSLDQRTTLESIFLRNPLLQNMTLRHTNICRVFDPLCAMYIGIRNSTVREYLPSIKNDLRKD